MLMHTPCVLAFDDFRAARVKILSQMCGERRMVDDMLDGLFYLYNREVDLAANVVSISLNLD